MRVILKTIAFLNDKVIIKSIHNEEYSFFSFLQALIALIFGSDFFLFLKTIDS